MRRRRLKYIRKYEKFKKKKKRIQLEAASVLGSFTEAAAGGESLHSHNSQDSSLPKTSPKIIIEKKIRQHLQNRSCNKMQRGR